MRRCKECGCGLLDEETGEYCNAHTKPDMINSADLIAKIEQYRQDLDKIGWIDNRTSTIINTIIRHIG